MKNFKYIDLFAGIGGLRIPFDELRFSGAHFTESARPTIFCQFSEIICSGVLLSPIPQFAQVFSIKSFMLKGSLYFVKSSPMGNSINSESNRLSSKEVNFL